MNPQQIIALAILAAQTLSQMYEEGRQKTNDQELAALQAAMTAQQTAEDQFEADRKG